VLCVRPHGCLPTCIRAWDGHERGHGRRVDARAGLWAGRKDRWGRWMGVADLDGGRRRVLGPECLWPDGGDGARQPTLEPSKYVHAPAV
jgi:hypothetical protein